jgi:ClpP class serine protease
VVSGGFGFVDLMQKLGVERRLRTSGAHKARSDAFAPQNPEDEQRLKSIMDQLHREFIDLVKQRRVGKLKDHPHLFEGEVFTAREGMDLGLIDGFGTLHGEIARRFGASATLKTLGPVRPPLIQRFFSGLGRWTIDGALEALEERALLSRYGL